MTISSCPPDMTSLFWCDSDRLGCSNTLQTRFSCQGFPAVPVDLECQIIWENTTVIKLMDAYIPAVTFHSHLNISSFNMSSRQSWRARGWCWFLYVFFIELSSYPLWMRWSLKWQIQRSFITMCSWVCLSVLELPLWCAVPSLCCEPKTKID